MSLHAKAQGAYARESTEAYENAQIAYSYLLSLGWTLPAFCAVWGNVESESGYNPWRWQSDYVVPKGSSLIDTQAGHAYGWVQFDPAGKYINNAFAKQAGYYGPNYSDYTGKLTDGLAQLRYINSYADYYPVSAYPISFESFKQATIENYSIDYLTRAWFYNYERGTWNDGRITAASYWYSTLTGTTPVPVPRPDTPGGGALPIWLLFKLKENQKGGLDVDE